MIRIDDKRFPTSYHDAEQRLDGAACVPLMANTVLIRVDVPVIGGNTERRYVVRYHRTNIVVFHPDGRVTLNTDGYRTVSTKQRINACLFGRGVRVCTERRTWYIVRRDGIVWDRDVDFDDNMMV